MPMVNRCFVLLRNGNQLETMFSHLFRFEMKRQCQLRNVTIVQQ